MPTNNSINTGSMGILQIVSGTTTANSDCSAIFPCATGAIIDSNEAVPQQTDGTEIVTATITPRSSKSRILVEYFGNLNYQPAVDMMGVTALFRDSVSDALTATISLEGLYNSHTLTYIEASGSTAARTYKIRVGPVAAHTLTINGSSGVQFLGGTQNCRLTLYEIG